MKRILLLALCLWTSFGILSAQASEEALTVVNRAVSHVNDYLLNPIDLTDANVDWSWSIITGTDISDGCRGRDLSMLPLTDVFYDVNIFRLNENYHYRVTMDEHIIIPCVELANVPDNVLPQLADALSDLNRRVHMQLTHNDIRWTWAERQFEDYTLGCGDSEVTSKYNHRTNGYIIEFQLQGKTWEYRVSADRLIVKLCSVE